MIPTQTIFEAHLNVANLRRSMAFYGKVLRLELAQLIEARGVAFYWVGGRGNSMLGLWEVGTSPQKMILHTAFRVSLADLLEAPAKLAAANIVLRDIEDRPAKEPVVLAWMPAAAVYFHDPDGNILEFLAMLPETPRPEVGIVQWSEWKRLNVG
jgi:lactoylglutathione lyase